MTAFCNGGISAPKIGAQLAVGVGSAYAAQLLELAAAEFLWPVIPWLVVPEILLNNFCATDPPPIPTFTQAEGNALNQLQVGDPNFVSGLGKAVQLVENLVWHDQCYCQTGTPGTVSPIQPPAGVTVVLQPTPQTAPPCAHHEQDSTVRTGNFQLNLKNVLTWPGNVTTAVFTWVVIQPSTSGSVSFTIQATYYDAFGTQLSQSPNLGLYQGTAIGTFPLTFDVPPNTGNIIFTATQTAGTGTVTVNESANLYCGGATGTPQQPCCPPDPTTQATLNAILQMVTLIQRQAAPFAYVEGQTFSGLSGSGTLAVQGVIGAKVNIDAIPQDAGLELGSPPNYWLDSWINWGNADGWLQREWLKNDPQVSLPPLAGQYTKLGYSFRPLITAEITLLIREP